MYDIDKINANTLTQDDVVGSFQVACTVVAQNKDQFCTYEILIFTDGMSSQSYRSAISSSDAGFGTSIVTGSLSFAENDGGFLLVEATEDDFAETDDFNVGHVLNQAKKEMLQVLKLKQDKQAEIEAAKAVQV